MKLLYVMVIIACLLVGILLGYGIYSLGSNKATSGSTSPLENNKNDDYPIALELDEVKRASVYYKVLGTISKIETNDGISTISIHSTKGSDLGPYIIDEDVAIIKRDPIKNTNITISSDQLGVGNIVTLNAIYTIKSVEKDSNSPVITSIDVQ